MRTWVHNNKDEESYITPKLQANTIIEATMICNKVRKLVCKLIYILKQLLIMRLKETHWRRVINNIIIY